MDDIFKKDTPGSDPSPYVETIRFFQEEIGRQVRDLFNEENEKIRQDFVNRSRWWINTGVTALAILITLAGIASFQFTNLFDQVNDFNRELRDTRDRVTVIETERSFEKAPCAN